MSQQQQKTMKIALKAITIKLPIYSSLMGRDNYIGFFIDFVIACLASLSGYIVIVLSGSIYIGIYFYVNAMVRDMKMNIMANENDVPDEPFPKPHWSIFVKETNIHHMEIIR